MTATTETRLRDEIAEFGAFLTGQGLAHGSTGNISVRLEDGWLITPTNSRLGRLDPARIAKLDPDGRLTAGDPPSKEAFLHRCVYEMRPERGQSSICTRPTRSRSRAWPASIPTTCCRRSPPITRCGSAGCR